MSRKKTVSGTREWASAEANCMIGCRNNCRYCYAKANAVHSGKATPESWAIEIKGPLPAVRKHEGVTMFPVVHDITEGNLLHCLEALKNLLKAGNKVLVVSKPHPSVITNLCDGLRKTGSLLDWKPRILFRFTMGSMDPDILGFWEPNAPTFAERLYSLMWAFNGGWQTSVSMEPMLDTNHDNAIRLVKTVVPYVTDAIWIGKANRFRMRCFLNAGKLDPDVDREILALEASQNNDAIKALYETVSADSSLATKVKWKESIKKVVGIKIPNEIGLDI